MAKDSLSARRTDLTIRGEMPYPIASAWHLLSLCTSDQERCDRLIGCFEVTLRTLAAYLLPDYLRGEPSSRVENAIQKLDRPMYGHWIALIRELIGAIAARSESTAFMPDAASWFFDNDGQKPSEHAKLLYQINDQRNRIVHGGPSVGSEHARERAFDLLAGMRQLLESVRWLADYRAFRVLELEPTRNRTFQGRVQFLIGHVELNEPVLAEWQAPLLRGVVYVADRTGEGFLELSPFLQVIPGQSRQEHCFLFREVPSLKKMVIVHDPSGTEKHIGVVGKAGVITFSQWLEERTSRSPHLPNQGYGDRFRGKSASSGPNEELGGTRFRVIELLGDGGMGKVWRVFDTQFEDEAALKVLDAAVADDPVFKERFRREAKTMRGVNHSGILPLQEFGTLDDGRMFLKMPVARGGNLRDRMQPGGLPEDQVLDWARQILRALAHLHEKQIIHRDLKPSNFLFDEEGMILLSDFGIALAEEDTRITRTLEQMGTLAYMAPEQRTGKNVTTKVDLYSAALILHELITGEQVASNPGKGVSGRLGQLIREIGNEDPAARPTPMAALSLIEEREKPRGEKEEAGPPVTSVWKVERFGEVPMPRGSTPAPSPPQESTADKAVASTPTASWRKLHKAGGSAGKGDGESGRHIIEVDSHGSRSTVLLLGGLALIAMVGALVVGWKVFGSDNRASRSRRESEGSVSRPEGAVGARDASSRDAHSARTRPLRLGYVRCNKKWVREQIEAVAKALHRRLKRRVDLGSPCPGHFLELAERLVARDPTRRIDIGRFSAITYVIAKHRYPELQPLVIQHSKNPGGKEELNYFPIIILKCSFFDGKTTPEGISAGRLCRQLSTRTDTKDPRVREILPTLVAFLGPKNIHLRHCMSSSGFVYPMYQLYEWGYRSDPPGTSSVSHANLAYEIMSDPQSALGAVFESIVSDMGEGKKLARHEVLLREAMNKNDVKIITLLLDIPKDIYVSSTQVTDSERRQITNAFVGFAMDGDYKESIRQHMLKVLHHYPWDDSGYSEMRNRICAFRSLSLPEEGNCDLLRSFRKSCRSQNTAGSSAPAARQ